MKRIFTMLFALFCITAYAQTDWYVLEQPFVHLKYKVPKGWYIGGYKSPQKCKCTGAVLNSSETGDLNMVIFYSETETMDSLSRQNVWGYNFDDQKARTVTPIASPSLSFVQQISFWKEYPTVRVLRLKTTVDRKNYLIYFWAEESLLQSQMPNIEKIVQSVEVDSL